MLFLLLSSLSPSYYYHHHYHDHYHHQHHYHYTIIIINTFILRKRKLAKSTKKQWTWQTGLIFSLFIETSCGYESNDMQTLFCFVFSCILNNECNQDFLFIYEKVSGICSLWVPSSSLLFVRVGILHIWRLLHHNTIVDITYQVPTSWSVTIIGWSSWILLISTS